MEEIHSLAEKIRKKGEEVREEERKLLNRIVEKWGKDSIKEDFLLYIILASHWIGEAKEPANYILHIYSLLPSLKEEEIKKAVSHFSLSYYMAAVNVLQFWLPLLRELREEKDPLVIQRKAEERRRKRTQHWILYAPLQAAVVVGEIMPPLPEIKPPLGNQVMQGFRKLGLPFTYPPTMRELEIIHSFLLHLAKLSQSNHLLIEMGIWKMGGEK